MTTVAPETCSRQWTTIDLISLNYRQLQSKAKELELPGNLKHDVLLEIIKARYIGNEDLVRKILANEKDSRARKKAAKKLLQCSFYPATTPQGVSPQIKRVGRPRKKSLDDSYASHRSRSRSPDLSYGDKRNTSMSALEMSLPIRTSGMPIAHSIQQLLMDRRVPNAATKKQLPYNFSIPTTPSHSERYTFKSVHRSMKDNSGGDQIYQDNFNWQVRKPWENGNTQSNTNSTLNALPSNIDYSCSSNPQLSYFSHLPSLGNLNNSQFAENGDLNNSGEYLPDLDGLLSSSGPTLPLNIAENSILPQSSTSLTHYPPIFLRQDLWPYQDNTTSSSYQPTVPYSTQTCHDYGNWPIWNSTQYSPYLNNPTPGYSEEVIISETQNSDTLSAPENPDNLPPPSYYSGSTVLPENDNQVYWPRTDSGSSNIVGATTFSTCSGSQIQNSSNDLDKSGLSHMRVSVVDTQEWTYEYSSSSGIFTQQFL